MHVIGYEALRVLRDNRLRPAPRLCLRSLRGPVVVNFDGDQRSLISRLISAIGDSKFLHLFQFSGVTFSFRVLLISVDS